MKINKIGYLIKEGIRGIFLHGFMSFAAICVTVACLLIVGSFSCLVYNVNLMVEDLNKTNEIVAYIDETYSEADAQTIETKIRQQVDNVLDANLKPREEALKEFIADHQGDESLAGVVASDLRHRVIVLLEDNSLMEQTVNDIYKITGVVKISAAFELAEGFTTLQNILQVSSIAVIAVLLLVSLVIISNTVKLGMHERRDEIAIMKMVGATNGFIRLPFVVEGFTLGMLGAGVAFGLEWLLYDMMAGKLNAYDSLSFLSFVPFTRILPLMIPVFVGAGMFVGMVGSWNSIRKYMNV